MAVFDMSREAESARARRVRLGFGIANLSVALFVGVAVFRLLPSRWWVVDGGAVVVATLLGASGVALLRNHRLASIVTRVAAWIVLVLGLALFATIVLTASWLSGVYSQVGTTGAIVFGLVAALVLPYLVVLPAFELAWLGPRPKADGAPPSPGAAVPSSVPAAFAGESHAVSGSSSKRKRGKRSKRRRPRAATGARRRVLMKTRDTP